ncbi:MAG TPA: hypothetical protein DCM14_00155, partial [Clostridiales bacterium UBA8153]|nr:hypothetical protein [Clostridiales bacterium UBA8153]
MMRVVWKRLLLRGFGCYAGEKELVLHDGLNVVIGPNEHGKSTLVTGLIAVLYGLPGSTDPAKFGKARYRNWSGAGAFAGELEFAADGELYQVKRDFDTDRISLAKRGATGWQELARGEHRMRARRQNVPYLKSLQQLVGIASAELFTATFCITQPLPAQDQLDAALVQLLSGAGGSYRQGLEKLGLALQALTRYTGDRGVTPGNQRQDRRLEQLEREADALRQQIQAHGQLLDSLPAVQAELARAVQEQQELSGRLQEAEQSLRAWGEWRNHRMQYLTCRNEQRRLGDAVGRAEELARQEAALQSSLEAQYGAILSYPPQTGDRLIRLQNQAAQSAQLASELEACREEQDKHGQHVARLEERIKTELAAVAGRTGLSGQHRELLLRLEEQERLSRQLAAARARKARARSRLDALADWSRLGPAPSTVVGERRRAAQALREAWQAYLGYRQEHADIEAELQGELDWFNAASDEARAACAQGSAGPDRLAYRLEQARGARERAQARLDACHTAEQAYAAEFGPLTGLDEAGAQAMDAKLGLATQRQELERTGRQALAHPHQLLILGGAGVLAAVLFGTGHHRWAAAVLVAVAGWWLAARRVRYRRQLTALDRALAELEREHPFLAAWDAGELIRMRERYRLSRAQADALAAQRAELPPTGELAAMDQELAAAQAAVERCHELTAGAQARYADPAAAFARWERRRQRREELEQSLRAWQARQLGTSAGDPGSHPVGEAQEAWRELASLAGVVGAPVDTVASLALWLNGRDDGWWQETVARAREWEEVNAELMSADVVEQALTAGDREGVTPAARLEGAIARLLSEVAPFDGSHRTEDLQQQVNEWQQVEAEVQATRRLYQECHRRGQRLEDDTRELTSQIDAGSQGLESLLAAAAGDYGRALAIWQDFAREREQKDRASAGLQAVLTSQGAATVEELRLRTIDAGNQAGVALLRWQ